MLMKKMAFVIVVTGLSSGGFILAQDRPAQNPRAGDAEVIRAGTDIFRSRCAECHGLDAKGVRGPDLTGLRARGVSDERLLQTVRRGVPGTEMPAFFGPDGELLAIMAYLQTLNTVAPEQNPTGNAANGEGIFRANCASCHTASGRGGNLGPDLSRIGSGRSRTALINKVRHASSFFVTGYEPVTIVTRGGQRINGVKKNEDAHSIQIMDSRERLQGYRKADLREVINETASVMPDFGPDRLNDQDLDDLVRYLGTLRESTTNSP
jgi:putative heme-binding domain-containing protein